MKSFKKEDYTVESIDPLVECLVILTKLNKVPYSKESLVAGLPTPADRETPQLFTIDKAKSEFSRAAKHAGLNSALVKRKIKNISPLVLPVILLLKDGNACILTGFDKTKEHGKIIFPEVGEEENWIKIEDLEQEYMGFAFYVKKELEIEKESKEFTLEKDKEHWFWGTLRRSANIYSDAIVASLLINIFVLSTPLFTMNVYDRVVPNNAVETLWVLAIGVIVIFIFDTILKFIRSYFLEIAGKKNDIIMSSILFEKVMDLKTEAYPKYIGTFANHLKEFGVISSFFASTTLAVLIDLPFVVIFLIVIYSIAGKIVMVPFLTILFILIYTFIISKPLQDSIVKTYESSARKSGILIESLGGLETLKTLGGVGQTQWKWEETTGDIANKGITARIFSASITTVSFLLIQINTVLILIVGVYMIKDIELTMGGLIATVILASRAIAPMGQVASLISNYEQVKTTYKSLDEIMNLPVERPEGKKFVQRPMFQGKIEFRNVTFSYPESSVPALKDISFTIHPGEKVAIVGMVGSGKTTIEKLILGLYHPDEGSIFIDDIDISQIDPADLRKSIAYVPQDIVLFKGTLRENITLRSHEAVDEEIIRASENSGLSDFVNSHPKGFDMDIGERGAGVSGGQKQNIAVARALLSDFSIALFDEPTNSIDGGAESKLIKSLKEVLREKTLVLVTHKNTVLELADRVMVVNKGKVVLDGEKDKVLKALK